MMLRWQSQPKAFSFVLANCFSSRIKSVLFLAVKRPPKHLQRSQAYAHLRQSEAHRRRSNPGNTAGNVSIYGAPMFHSRNKPSARPPIKVLPVPGNTIDQPKAANSLLSTINLLLYRLIMVNLTRPRDQNKSRMEIHKSHALTAQTIIEFTASPMPVTWRIRVKERGGEK